MTTQIVPGPRTWSMTRDQEGYRTYKITFLVKATSHLDGPATVLLTPGIPLPGTLWVIDNDRDLWAWCRPDIEIRPMVIKEKNYYWEVECTFSNKPVDRDKQRCNQVQIEDPLLEPAKVSISISNHQVEATVDRFGNALLNSCWEPLAGPVTEFSVGRGMVKIEQNVASALLGYQLPFILLNTVNISTLWGLAPRTIRLANFTCERRFYGSCYLYYNRVLEFEVDVQTFDKVALDEGTKILNGHWQEPEGIWVLDNINGEVPDPLNPQHFERFTDRKGNATRVILNGAGLPAGGVVSLSGVYISRASGNVGNSLLNTTKWLAFSGTIDSSTGNIVPEEYDGAFGYPRGSVVTVSGISPGGGPVVSDYYLAIKDVLFGFIPPDNPDKWLLIPGVTNRGTFNPATTYTPGQYVKDNGTATGAAGFRYIEKYANSNFLVLGIPITF